MNKTTTLRTFNIQFFDFINDIISIVPENEDIIIAKTFFEVIKKTNPTIIIKVWYNFIYSKYSSVIDEGDIKFFIEKDYEEDLGLLSNSKDILKGINSIREPIKTMSLTNQGLSMKYIQILSKLSELYNK